MIFDDEDPRFTAYLLGELGEAEHAEIDELLASNAEARSFVDTLRETTEALEAELGGESSDGALVELGDLGRARIAGAAERGRPTKAWIFVGVAGAAAAALLLFPNLKRESIHENAASGIVYVGVLAPTEAPNSDPASSENVENSVSGLTTRTSESGTPGYYLRGEVRDEAQKSPSPSHHSGRSASDLLSRGRGHEKDKSARALDGELDLRTRRQLGSLGYFGPDDFIAGKLIVPAADAYGNPFVSVAADPLSTFSSDVDTASYSQMRRLVRSNSLPPGSSVRIEEFLNYFDYEYSAPKSGEPFGVVTEVSEAPWNPAHRLMRVGIKARDVVRDRRPRANLVFLLDVSGSMSDKDKLPLLKESFSLLLDRLDSEDRIAIVVYAGASGVVLPSTAVSKRGKILKALGRLKSGGSTNGGAGIELAYQIAQKSFIDGGVNRVILATDGDFNVGATSRSALTELIEQKAKSDIFLTVLGVGMTNFNDDGTMEQLADKGNGNYAYIDSLAEARKVLVEQIHGTLVTVAKDVKFQIEFNPTRVAQYRLIGYENRVLDHADFNDDSEDAGDIGAGHTVTALYELIPPGAGKVDKLRYQTTASPTSAADSDELLTLKVRYKTPAGRDSRLMSYPVFDRESGYDSASADFKFASAVAGFGMLLRGSEHKGNTSFGAILDWAREGRGTDPHGYRKEFISLVKRAKDLYPRPNHP